MVTLPWIAHTRYLPQKPQQFITNLPEVVMPDQVQDTTVKRETGKANHDHILIFKDTTAQVVMTHTEATQGHNTGANAATKGAVHNSHAPLIEATTIARTVTHHINLIIDHPHIEVLQLTNPGITVDYTANLPTNPQGRTHTDQVHIPVDHKGKHTSKGT